MANTSTATASPRRTPITLIKQCTLAVAGLAALMGAGGALGWLMCLALIHFVVPGFTALLHAMAGFSPVTILQDLGADHVALTVAGLLVFLVSICALCKSGQVANPHDEGDRRSVARVYPKSFAALAVVALITGLTGVPMASGAMAEQGKAYGYMALVTFHTALMDTERAAEQAKAPLTGSALAQRVLTSPQWQRDDQRAVFSVVSVNPEDDSMTVRLTLTRGDCEYMAAELRSGNGGAISTDNGEKTSPSFVLGTPHLQADYVDTPTWFAAKIPSCPHARNNVVEFRSMPYFLNDQVRYQHQRAMADVTASTGLPRG